MLIRVSCSPQNTATEYKMQSLQSIQITPPNPRLHTSDPPNLKIYKLEGQNIYIYALEGYSNKKMGGRWRASYYANLAIRGEREGTTNAGRKNKCEYRKTKRLNHLKKHPQNRLHNQGLVDPSTSKRENKIIMTKNMKRCP